MRVNTLFLPPPGPPSGTGGENLPPSESIFPKPDRSPAPSRGNEIAEPSFPFRARLCRPLGSECTANFATGKWRKKYKNTMIIEIKKYIVKCDGCGAVLSTDNKPVEFPYNVTAIQAARHNGWLSAGGKEYCPYCKTTRFHAAEKPSDNKQNH